MTRQGHFHHQFINTPGRYIIRSHWPYALNRSKVINFAINKCPLIARGWILYLFPDFEVSQVAGGPVSYSVYVFNFRLRFVYLIHNANGKVCRSVRVSLSDLVFMKFNAKGFCWIAFCPICPLSRKVKNLVSTF